MDLKARYGFWIVIAGLVSVIVLYIGTILIFANLTPENLANNVVACMGAITGVIGSLVGAYFGVQLPNRSTAAIENAQNILQAPSPQLTWLTLSVVLEDILCASLARVLSLAVLHSIARKGQSRKFAPNS